MLQGVDSIFDTDLFLPIIERPPPICRASPTAHDAKTDVALRVMADHGRAMTMLVADGVLPANEGRGYVLRRVIRRAVLAARRLGVDSPSCRALVEAATEVLGDGLPGLVEQHDLMSTRWLARKPVSTAPCGPGWACWKRRSPPARQRARRATWPSRLHDTHGFPIELTEELAAEAGVEVDRAGFDAAMDEQRERARAAARAAKAGDESAYRVAARADGPTPFVGRCADALRGAGPRGRRPGRRRSQATSRSSWTAPRSTPRAAARWATPGPSSPRPGSAEVYDTVVRRCPG